MVSEFDCIVNEIYQYLYEPAWIIVNGLIAKLFRSEFDCEVQFFKLELRFEQFFNLLDYELKLEF